MTWTNVSIVIPAYNCADYIEKTLNACLNQSWPGDNLEIVIVDDGSTDNSAEIIKKFPVKYIHQQNAGPAKARNTGWQNSTGQIVCFTDSDCVPEKDWVKKAVENFTSDDIAGVGGSYSIMNPDSMLSKCIHQEIIQRHNRMSVDASFLGSFNVAYRKKILDEVNGFNESFKNASGEDNELSYKIRKAGYKLIFNKDNKVGHFHTEKLIKYLKEQKRHGYWRMVLYKYHPNMICGDGYSNLLDYIQPPLAILTVPLALSAVIFQNISTVSITVTAIAMLLLLQLPEAVKAILETGKISYLCMIWVFFLRAFARGIGMLNGLITVFIRSRKK